MSKTFSTYLPDFKAHLTYELHLSVHTVSAYLTDLKQLSAYLEKEYNVEQPQKVALIHLRSWLSSLKEKGLSNRSLKRKTASLNRFFQFLIENKVLCENPGKQLLLPKAEKSLPDFLNEQQTQKLTEEVLFPEDFKGQTNNLIIELLYQTGMRRSELIALKEKDIDFGQKQIKILGKGSKMRIVPLNEELINAIKKYIRLKKKNIAQPTKKLLSLNSGKPLYPNYVYRTVKAYLSVVTTLVKKSPHLLRHTFASQLLNNGADLMSIKDLLGHSSLAATQVYTHLNIERLKEVYKKAHPKSGE